MRKIDAFIIALGAAFCLFCSPRGISWGGDNYVYVLLAKSLRMFSYREFWDISNKVHSQYLPGYPLLIVLTSTNIMVQRVLATGYYVIGLVFLSLWLKEPIEKRIIILALTAFTPVMIKFGGMEYSEMPFFAFAMASLYFMNRFKAFVPLALFSFLIRPVGIALFAAGAFQYKGWKRITIIIFGLCCLGLSIAMRKEVGVVNPYDISQGSVQFIDIVSRVFENLSKYVKIIVGQL